jgi:RNA polymerase sigma-70 factor (ECF subfamily)
MAEGLQSRGAIVIIDSIGKVIEECDSNGVAMGERDEAGLIQRAVSGDEVAFQLLFEQYMDTLTRFAERRMSPVVRRRVSAADVVQEAQIVAMRRIRDFEDRGDDAFRRWLLRIVRLKTSEAVRRHVGVARRDARRELTRGRRTDTGQHRGANATPSQVAIGHELREKLDGALMELPPHYRDVFRMARLEGMTLAEIAERIGKSREAVKKMYARAIRRLHEALAATGGLGG